MRITSYNKIRTIQHAQGSMVMKIKQQPVKPITCKQLRRKIRRLKAQLRLEREFTTFVKLPYT